MLLPRGIMIALVNGERFEFYRNDGTETEPRLEAISTPDFELHNKGAGVRHKVSPANPSATQLDEDAHAAAVAKWLNSMALDHAIDRLVIAAAPRTLGELRRHYHGTLKSCLVAELDKDLVGRPTEAVVTALRAEP